jgi:lipoate-protein ligase A
VANLTEFVQELNHDRMCDAVVQSFLDYHGATADPELLDKTDLEAVPSLREYYDTMADWEWRFGRTPQFSHRLQERFEWGLIDLHLDVERGVIRETRLFSDALDVTLIEDLQGALAGVRYDTAHLAEALVGLAAVHQDRAAEIAEFRNWIVSSIG